MVQQGFGELEFAIMDALWRAEQPLIVRDIRASMFYDREVAYTTVMTVTNILFHKGMLHREKSGRAWRYWPQEDRGDHTARLMLEVLDGSDDPSTAMTRFIERCSEEQRRLISRALHGLPRPRRATP
ncbi:BlaI/MecI/CopY family transcriptional regulator [Spiractinospora alimapuensis]|uniref:BlaI/MecI/CopY family transcriptional regulator n=1 Tax=Spiractinospora alimapuensis TaxID=2820884 RepID=UPI0022AB0BD1|nr:BlaI/MecI/CopY family transcriptional regulator [Spiractinospora alimapuensis]